VSIIEQCSVSGSPGCYYTLAEHLISNYMVSLIHVLPFVNFLAEKRPQQGAFLFA